LEGAAGRRPVQLGGEGALELSRREPEEGADGAAGAARRACAHEVRADHAESGTRRVFAPGIRATWFLVGVHIDYSWVVDGDRWPALDEVRIDRDFAQYLLQAFDDRQQYGVHQLFNDRWRFAPDAVKAKCLAGFEGISERREFLQQRYYVEPLELDWLAQLSDGSLGRVHHEFIVSNGLAKHIAIDCRAFHQMLEQPLAEVRRRHRIAPVGRRPLAV
jgi:hypothetical protein